jgi:hypothetical protein
MSYISSLILVLVYIYVLMKFPYIKQSKVFLLLFSLFVFRLILSFNHEISFLSIIAGQSLNSLSSILSVFFLLLVVSKKYINAKAYLPIYFLIMSAFASTIYSGLIVGGGIVMMKWLLLLLILFCLIQLFEMYELEAVLKPFFYIFIGILISQFLSFILRQGKDSESLVSVSNSVSYIGGYAHEAAFSVLLFMGMFISSVLMINKRIHPAFPFVFFIGLILANYRTAIISAILPLVFVYFSFYFVGARKDNKAILFSLSTVGFFVVTLLFGASVIDRFGELGDALSNLGELMSIDYSLFSLDEKRLLSSRLYLWNMYLTEYGSFSFGGLVFGAGPEAWLEYFEVYAHNSFVGAAFDLGIVGVLTLAYLFYQIFKVALSIKDVKKKTFLLSFIFGFFVMSNSTMPFWAIEGIYNFAFIYAVTIWLSLSNSDTVLASDT